MPEAHRLCRAPVQLELGQIVQQLAVVELFEPLDAAGQGDGAVPAEGPADEQDRRRHEEEQRRTFELVVVGNGSHKKLVEAIDGVSCTLCHQIEDVGHGLRAMMSFLEKKDGQLPA